MNWSNERTIEFVSSAPISVHRYGRIADEYYDGFAHPTCADFRDASEMYLDRLWTSEAVVGRIADIGCGRSLLAKKLAGKSASETSLVLVDESSEMIVQNDHRLLSQLESRVIDVERGEFGRDEFDWIFSILGDPYNTESSWHNIATAMKRGGRCEFVVPSHVWSQKFRAADASERCNLARFVCTSGDEIYVPSYILRPDEQVSLIAGVGLKVIQTSSVARREVRSLRSPKTSILSDDDALLDIYSVVK